MKIKDSEQVNIIVHLNKLLAHCSLLSHS